MFITIYSASGMSLIKVYVNMTTSVRFVFITWLLTAHRAATGPAFNGFLPCRGWRYIRLVKYKDIHKGYITLKRKIVRW